MYRKKGLIAALLMVMGAATMEARVTMGPLFNDHMVLQQDTEVRVWGWTDKPGSTVTVKTSWAKGKVKAKSGDDGRWDVRLATPKGGFTPQTVSVSDGDGKVVINDVLIGEVWLASGQSNMEQPLHGFNGCPVENSAQYIAEAGKYKDRLHFCTVDFAANIEPQDTVGAHWQNCEPRTARDFCAVAYFFGIRLLESMPDCPVGMINSSLGATRVEGWTPREICATYPGEDFESETIRNAHLVRPAENVERSLPVVFYNAMIHPIEGYGIKGFLWYQAEANVNTPEIYEDRFVNMVQCWRERWGLGDLPFYCVEICPYDYYWAKDKRTVPLIREAQLKATHRLPKMGMVCTNDLVKDYEYWQIHPSMKKEVGDRLCLWALGDAYGIEGIDYRYPEYKRMEMQENKEVRIWFDNAEDGFNRNVGIEGFEMCGPDSVWHTASAGVGSNYVNVRCSEVQEPVAVRYAFKSWCLGNLKANSGLPVIPFRTDDWAR